MKHDKIDTVIYNTLLDVAFVTTRKFAAFCMY